jgi:SAM-dependent methyltransferase
MSVTREPASPLTMFRSAYAAHRVDEGRAYALRDLLTLPYLRTGPHSRQWAVRARTFDAFARRVLGRASHTKRSLRVLDLGAGNGWLSYRAALLGHHPTAVDIRDDTADGLGVASAYFDHLAAPFDRVCASFAELPFTAGTFDVAVFNASLHYALNLHGVLVEVVRVVRSGGRIVILDSPFYMTEAEGAAMVAEKRRHGAELFGDRASVLLAPPFTEFLTADRLRAASDGRGLQWRRHRVRYPLRYEFRPLEAIIRRRRRPSRFDLWESLVP